MNTLIQHRRQLLLAACAAATLAYFVLSLPAQAVMPPPDGGYPGKNTAEGENALFNVTTGHLNTAVGFEALYNNTAGNYNTAAGYKTLLANTTGGFNTASGLGALSSNTSGDANTATGLHSLDQNTEGLDNTATGVFALRYNVTGSNNIGVGLNAGVNITGGSNIDIANEGVAGESNTIRIGRTRTQKATYIAGISGVGVAGTPVVVNSSGQLGVAPSSERFKEAVKPMDKTSEAILALKPVSFRYKRELDPEAIPQFGLIAEQVEKVNPDLVARDEKRQVYTVRYEAVNAMLLNEFLKEHRTVEEQETMITRLKSAVVNEEVNAVRRRNEIEALNAMLKQQGTQIQKVSRQLEMRNRAPESIANNE